MKKPPADPAVRPSASRLLATALVLAAVALQVAACGSDDAPLPKLTDEEKIERVGNAWAPAFAAESGFARYMGQPALERTNCQRISGPIENCTPPSSEFRESFAAATVERVVVEDHKAAGPLPGRLFVGAAAFSNGERVKFFRADAGLVGVADGHDWFIARFGDHAGRAYFEP